MSKGNSNEGKGNSRETKTPAEMMRRLRSEKPKITSVPVVNILAYNFGPGDIWIFDSEDNVWRKQEED